MRCHLTASGRYPIVSLGWTPARGEYVCGLSSIPPGNTCDCRGNSMGITSNFGLEVINPRPEESDIGLTSSYALGATGIEDPSQKAWRIDDAVSPRLPSDFASARQRGG